MSQQVLSKKVLTKMVYGGDVSWLTITMKHRGRDYYLQSFQGSQLAFLIRPSAGLQRNSEGLPALQITILHLKNYNEEPGESELIDAFESYYKKLGYTRFQYISGLNRDGWKLRSDTLINLFNFSHPYRSTCNIFTYTINDFNIDCDHVQLTEPVSEVIDETSKISLSC